MTLDMANMIRITRKKSGLSQLQLAKLAGVGKTAVFDLEKGKATIQLRTLLKILEALNIKLQLIPPVKISIKDIVNATG